MPNPFALARSLFMITDPDASTRDVSVHMRAAIRGGATHLVVRRPKASAASLYAIATEFCPTFRSGADWSLIVHDRIDVALTMHAQGAHLGRGGLPIGPAKGLLGRDRVLGTSVHNSGQANSAVLELSDYIMFGHVFDSESHPGQPGCGLDALREVCELVPIPVIAVGGITPERVDEVLAAGAAGVAVIRAISRAPDPELAARDLRRALDAAEYPHLCP